MSNDIKVKLSNVDRGINVINTYNSYKNRKVSEQILVQQKQNNRHLIDMKMQMQEANATNRKILENQIRELEQKEEQKYFKALSFNTNEIIERLGKVDDPMVLNYLIANFYDKTKNNLISANDTLEEINDKLFNKQILDKLNAIKNRVDQNAGNFSDNVLSKIDNLLLDLKEKEKQVTQIIKPDFKEKKIRDKWKVNVLRVFGIVVLGLIFLFFLLGTLVAPANSNEYYIMEITFLLLSGIPLFFLVRKERKWRKEFAIYKAEQDKKRNEEKNKKLEIEQQHEEELIRHKEILLNHPVFNAIQEINLNHPTFEPTTKEITELESNFLKKWGIE
jgi:hypothetical protein